jgi:hypothetical protein
MCLGYQLTCYRLLDQPGFTRVTNHPSLPVTQGVSQDSELSVLTLGRTQATWRMGN